MVARLLRERLGTLWPSVAGQSVLGLGYAAPYLRLWQEKSQRCIALMPARLGAARWPAGDQPNLCCSSQEDALPFPDLCFDRILLVHGLEAADNARRLLREVWRVLKDDGQVLIVAPNRRGLWAYVESTPFGQGQPVLLRPDRQFARCLGVPGGTLGRRLVPAAAAVPHHPAQCPSVGKQRPPRSATGHRRPDHHRSGEGHVRRPADRGLGAAQPRFCQGGIGHSRLVTRPEARRSRPAPGSAHHRRPALAPAAAASARRGAARRPRPRPERD